MAGKTNAVRLLETREIRFRLAEYQVEEDGLDAVSVAGKIGAEPERVFKTLVARGDGGQVLVFCVPGSGELDLKKAARVAGVKKVEMVRASELLPLTGYVRGGCSPIGMRKPYPTWIDETAGLFETVFVSAGVRGLQIELAPADLASLCEAPLADVAG